MELEERMIAGIAVIARNRREADHAPSGLPQVQNRIARKRKSQAVWSAATKNMEPTIGLEPMTCRLRIDCSTN